MFRKDPSQTSSRMELISWTLLLVILLALAGRLISRLARRFWVFYQLGHLPYPEPGHWLLGHIPAFRDRESARSMWHRFVTQRPRVFVTRMGFVRRVLLVHPETVSVLLKTGEPKSPQIYDFVRPWLGDGLLLSQGKRWSRDRRLLTQGFHFDILRNYVPIYRDAVSTMIGRWTETVASGRAVNATRTATMLTLDITLRCIMSYECHCQEDGLRSDDAMEYTSSVQKIGQLFMARFFNVLHHNDFFYSLSRNGKLFQKHLNVCHAISEGIITKRRKALEESGEKLLTKKSSRTLDFLDILLSVRDDDGQGLTDREVQEQVDTFLFEGHDTTASALQYSLYYLAKHPHLQEKCREEVQKAVGEDTEVRHEYLGELHYLTQFIKESMRISGTVPSISRELTAPLQVDEYTLPAGAWVAVPIFAVHNNPTVWKDPDTFDPDRFTPEECAKRHPFAFIPFSAGPRNCIGQSLAMDELKTVLSIVLLRFKLINENDEDLKPVPTMIMRPHKDIMLALEDLKHLD